MKLSPRMQHVIERLENGDHWTRCPLTGEHRIYETDEPVNPRTLAALQRRLLVERDPHLPILATGGGLR